MRENTNALLRRAIYIVYAYKHTQGYRQEDAYAEVFFSLVAKDRWEDLRSTVSRVLNGKTAVPMSLLNHYADPDYPRQPRKLRQDIANCLETIVHDHKGHMYIRNEVLQLVEDFVPTCDWELLIADDVSVDATIDMYTRLVWYAVCDARYHYTCGGGF